MFQLNNCQSANPLCKTNAYLLFVGLILLGGCSHDSKPRVEALPSPPSTVQTAQAPQILKAPPPQIAEVAEAVKRVFSGSVLVDTDRQPNFIVGDFNGDLSQDLAVVLKPAPENISELNQEFPTWILRDISRGQERNGPRLRVAANDVLLAVIHGYGSGGWREREATQAYLLKNAVGPGLTTRSLKDLLASNKGKKLPQLRGDVISEEVAGAAGFLYYASATYSWYDPKTFTGDEPERAMIHTARNQGNKK